MIVLEDTTTSITLQWEAVDCINRNGNVTGYSLLIGNMENMLYRDSSDTRVALSGLSPSTTYTIQVAAVNTTGIGSYSSPINTSRDGECGMHRCNRCTRYIYISSGSLGTLSFTSLRVSLEVNTEATSYDIAYVNINNTGCFHDSNTYSVNGNENTLVLSDLQENTEYLITVTALLSDGETEEDSFRTIIPATG